MKKNDAAHATAKFVFIVWRGARALRGGRSDVECKRERTIIAKTKQYLEESKSLKVAIEELESLLGPDDTDVDFRRQRISFPMEDYVWWVSGEKT